MLPSSNAFPEIPYLRRKFHLGISPYLSLQGGLGAGGWGLGAGGKVVFGWNRMVFRGDEGDLTVLTAGGGGEGSSTI